MEPEQLALFEKYLFQFGLDSANGQRILPVEMAVSLWQLVFSQVSSPHEADQPWFYFKYCEDWEAGDDDTVSGGASPAQKVATFLRETPPGYICTTPTLRKFEIFSPFGNGFKISKCLYLSIAIIFGFSLISEIFRSIREK